MASSTITQRTADTLRRVLDERGMTQEQLSEEAGIPMRTLSRRLHKSNPSITNLEELAAIAQVLDISIVDLIAPSARPALAAGVKS